MISELPLFQLFGAMARYAAESQQVSATNIAHANEPGYKAQQLESFEDFLTRAAHGSQTEGLDGTFKGLRAFRPTGAQGVNYAPGVWHHPLLVQRPDSDFLVVDRGGGGCNLEEHRFQSSVTLTG